MSALTDPVLRGKKDPTQDFLQDFHIIGGGEEVRQSLKDAYSCRGGWHQLQDNGEIIEAELFIYDVKEVDRIETVHDECEA